MSRKVVLAASAALMLLQAGCKKEISVVPAGETPEEKAVVAAPVAEAPTPTTPIPAAPVQPELAPPGIFYVISPARVETANGIVGLKPGTGLRRTRPGFYQSQYGEVALNSSQVTNDMVVARQAAKRDAAQQDQLKKEGEARAQALQAKAAGAVTAAQAPQAAQNNPAPQARPQIPVVKMAPQPTTMLAPTSLPASTPGAGPALKSKSSLNQSGLSTGAK